MKLVDSKIWFVKSNDRYSGQIYDFLIAVPSFLLNHPPNQFVKMTLVDFVLKRNKYPIDSANNRFNIAERQNGITINYQFSITPGNYNIYQLATYLQTALTAQSTYYTYTVDWDSISGHLTFTVATKTAFPFQSVSFDMTVDRSAYELLGFNQAVYSFSTGSPYSLSSVNMTSLTGQTAVYLRTNIGTNNLEYVDAELGLTDIFAKIPIAVPPYATIIFQDVGASLYNMYLQTNNISVVNFRLTNADDINLEFQDNYTMTFKIEFYQQDVEDQILSQMTDLVELNKIGLLRKQ